MFRIAAGAVEMWKSPSDFQGRWKRVENRGLVFHRFHGPSFPRLSAHRLRYRLGFGGFFRIESPPSSIR